MTDFKELTKKFLDSQSPSATAAKIVLALIFLGGIIVVGAVAPNIFSALGRLGPNRFSKKQVKGALDDLKKRRLIEVIKEKGNKSIVKITTKGGKRIKEFILDTLEIKKPKKWDRKWRIVIFDIPNFLNKARGALRATLKDLGMVQLQKSVWVFPYPCEDEVLFAANFLNVEKYVEIFEANYLADETTENRLLRIFKIHK